MIREDVTILIVENTDIEKAKDIALQAWNIKARGQEITIEFVEDTNLIYAWFLEDRDNNIRRIVESWGKVVDERKGIKLMLEYYDIDKEVIKEIDNSTDSFWDDRDVFIEVEA